MTDSYYVIFNRQGIDRFVRTNKFELKSGEYAVMMEIEVPDAVFVRPIIPTTKVTIPYESVRRTIEVETRIEAEQ